MVQFRKTHIASVDGYFLLGDFLTVLKTSPRKYTGKLTPYHRKIGSSENVVKLWACQTAFTGSTYTWSNNRQGSQRILERLDEGMATGNWQLASQVL